VTVLFLLAQAMRADPPPRVLCLDRDRGMERGIRALGGEYRAVRAGEPAGLGPFADAADGRDAPWLAAYAREILAGPEPLSPEQAEAVAAAARANVRAGPHLRTLAAFRERFRGLDDGGDLHLRLARWDEGGEHGWLFREAPDGAAGPALRPGRIAGVDLTEVMDDPAARAAWTAHAFRRIERTVEDGRPTLVAIDEAWKLLDDAWFSARLKDWLLTMRKKNCAVVLMTQRTSHLRESLAGPTILESAPTRLLFPNARTAPGELAPLGLNAAETAFLAGGGALSRLALWQLDGVSALLDVDLGGLGPWLHALAGGPGAPDMGARRARCFSSRANTGRSGRAPSRPCPRPAGPGRPSRRSSAPSHPRPRRAVPRAPPRRA